MVRCPERDANDASPHDCHGSSVATHESATPCLAQGKVCLARVLWVCCLKEEKKALPVFLVIPWAVYLCQRPYVLDDEANTLFFSLQAHLSQDDASANGTDPGGRGGDSMVAAR